MHPFPVQVGRATWLAAALAVAAAHAQPVAERSVGAAEREAVAVTVYNDDLALVRERRRVDLPAGLTRLSMREVAGHMRPETALLRAVSGPAIRLVEQNFDFDLLTPEKLLEKYVGREVMVIRSHPTSGEERREPATVLAAGQGAVLRFADRIETGVPGRLAFASVPPNLRERPTLSVLLDAGGGRQSLELSYLTGGLAWRADYVASLAADGKSLDLNGWVTISNLSGTDYVDATLQLVAGAVNRVRAARPVAVAMTAAAARTLDKAPAQESLLDYHLYSFERPTTLADNQTKQLALLSAAAVPVRREYLLSGGDWIYRDRYALGGQKQKPAIYLEFANKAPLGQPLPAGVVRVYAKDSRGAAQFVGEDRIEHTAKNETLRLRLGEAFDITSERKQLSYKKIGDNLSESVWRIELRNARDEAVTLKVQEALPGDWEMLRESQPHTRESARLATWNVTVPGNGATALEYGVRVKW